MSKRKVAVLCVALLVLLPVGFCTILPRIIFRDIYRKESEVTAESVTQIAGRELAVLCQTCRIHPDWFSDEPPFSPAWTPASVLKLQPNWVDISADGARVEFGGGLCHFGYLLRPALPQANGGPNSTWVLDFYTEASADRELGRFSLTSDDVLTETQFVDRAMAELDRRIASGRNLNMGTNKNAVASVQRIKFAIKHNQIGRLQRAIRETARQNPDAWLDVLLAYLIDVPSNPAGAAERLRQWADSKGDFSGWLMAAYAFERAGDTDAAKQAVSRAGKFPVNDPPWMSVNARVAGVSLCQRLYVAGQFDTCAMLCETILAYQGSGDDKAGSYQALRTASRIARSSSAPASVNSLEKGTTDEFDPFTGIEISALQAPAIP